MSAIGQIMFFAGFTYGPLIAMFFFGILSKRSLNDKLVPVMCLVAVGLTIVLWYFSAGGPGAVGTIENPTGVFGQYKIGFELIILNSLLTYASLFLISKKKVEALN